MPTLDFKGKQFVYSHHLSVPFRELKVVSDKSLPQEGKVASLDDNLIIHGDNLEALKALLPTHAGKVDCIFIDPPYNTGNEGWCYNDNVRSPLMQEWLKKSANPVDKEDLERHDKWLCMMWPRLMLLKELLTETGSIWVTLDDNEAHKAKLLLDEIFGEENFIGNIIWEKSDSPRMDADFVSTRHDHLFVYAKSKDSVLFKRLATNEESLPDHYDKISEDGRPYYLKPLRAMGGQGETREARPKLYFPMIAPDGSEVFPKLKNGNDGAWRWSKEKQSKEADRIDWISGRNGWVPYYRIYADGSDGTPPETIFYNRDVGSNRTSKREIRDIMAAEISFDTPKPTKLIKRILDIATENDSIILDSFAGSGTTAHAVLDANKKDNGSRKFILVECEDYADSLTAERVRRVINGYPFKGNQKQELLSEKITWSVFEKKHAELLEKIAEIEAKHSKDFDKIKKELKDGVLTVTGERKVDEFAPGIGGSFTYCTLGEPIQIESLLTGEAMPSYDALARYVFYTATGQSLETVAKASADGFIGETDLFRIHLFYRPDSEWLRSNEAALNADKVEAIAKNNATKKRTIVFAVAKFMSQKDLTEKRIEFCQLPYAIHRIMGA
ncbi:DNA methylase [Vibrio vulnificus CladeA-yb158]|uniref:site-specific DNA-methyltransferase n=1 Tax=Vibrio vulnificus TaxID=672 RepID=UPI00063DB9A7|nr:site-specific DNA-methyltransferase [Vibrio vulnificus]KLI68438.1 DNA methylase [Vibrio vulnificus CladeA-yb158]HAS6352348.1 site-specific DNA-methyltransferase [Vibrio vulnificus]HAS6366854.1 site-specific DNA-methyltransferase [Vibrio vulnificus]HDY7610722.1 site-specific DNA-methyltransferase [Vibrio vulnificus]